MNVWGKIVTKGYEFGARSNKTGVTEWFCLNDSEETKGRPEGANKIPEDHPKLRKKFFQVRRAIENLSYTEMSFEDQKNSRFEINLPEKRKTYAGSFEICGNSGSGKTVYETSLF